MVTQGQDNLEHPVRAGSKEARRACGECAPCVCKCMISAPTFQIMTDRGARARGGRDNTGAGARAPQGGKDSAR
eukprot:1029698-Alexandrium_andersonii.AAC.1